MRQTLPPDYSLWLEAQGWTPVPDEKQEGEGPWGSAEVFPAQEANVGLEPSSGDLGEPVEVAPSAASVLMKIM